MKTRIVKSADFPAKFVSHRLATSSLSLRHALSSSKGERAGVRDHSLANSRNKIVAI